MPLQRAPDLHENFLRALNKKNDLLLKWNTEEQLTL